MRHLEDKALCPHCRRELHRRPYMMSRRAPENVLSPAQIAWVVVVVMVLLVVTAHG